MDEAVSGKKPKLDYGPKEYEKVITNAEATAYGYYEYKNKKTSTGITITEKQVGKLIAVDNKKIRYGEHLLVFSRKTKKQIYDGIANDLCPSKPRNANNTILIDCLFKTKQDCLNFGRQDVTIFVVKK